MDSFKKNNKKEKSTANLLIIVILAVVAVLILSIALVFIFGTEYKKDAIKNLLAPESDLGKSPRDGELGTKPPAPKEELNKTLEKDTVEGRISPPAQSNASGSTLASSNGKLVILNSIETYNVYELVIGHIDGALEGLGDNIDRLYYRLWPPQATISSKIISKIDSTELEADVRPKNSTSTVYIELSLVSKTGDPVLIDSSNELYLSMPLAGYTFEDKTITIQQYDPSDPFASYTSYDVRDVINNEGGKITLSRLNGTYNSEVPYAYFKVRFS